MDGGSSGKGSLPNRNLGFERTSDDAPYPQMATAGGQMTLRSQGSAACWSNSLTAMACGSGLNNSADSSTPNRGTNLGLSDGLQSQAFTQPQFEGITHSQYQAITNPLTNLMPPERVTNPQCMMNDVQSVHSRTSMHHNPAPYDDLSWTQAALQRSFQENATMDEVCLPPYQPQDYEFPIRDVSAMPSEVSQIFHHGQGHKSNPSPLDFNDARGIHIDQHQAVFGGPPLFEPSGAGLNSAPMANQISPTGSGDGNLRRLSNDTTYPISAESSSASS
ncbi:MAG: hypothetical protein Q9225_007207, partial [Loekoesia sp. 1 TL-2023]